MVLLKLAWNIAKSYADCYPFWKIKNINLVPVAVICFPVNPKVEDKGLHMYIYIYSLPSIYESSEYKDVAFLTVRLEKWIIYS